MSGAPSPRSRGAERRRAWRSHVGVGAGGVAPPAEGVRGITPEKFRNFTCKILNFGAHLSKIIYLLFDLLC
jgi:hypothetical protein